MVCGLDVWHEKDSNCQSVAGFVATYNRSATKYWSKAVVQPNMGQESVSEIKFIMVKALANFNKMNGSLPERIIIFRDGVHSNT